MNASTIRSTNPIITTLFRISREGDHRGSDSCCIWWILADLLAKTVDRMKMKHRKVNQNGIGDDARLPGQPPHDRISPEAKRFYVRVGSSMVSPFPGSPVLDCVRSPWTGLVVEKHHHEGCEIPVHDHETLGLHLQTDGDVDMEWFCSGRSGRLRSTPGSMLLLPAGTRDSVIWHASTRRVIASIEPVMLKHAPHQMGLKGFCEFGIRWPLPDDQLSLPLPPINPELKSAWLI